MAHFAVTAIGADRPGIVAALTGALHDLGGNLEDVSSTILRGHFAMMLVVDASHDSATILRALEAAAGPLGVQVHVADVEAGAPERPRSTHVLTVYGADHPGIVAAVTSTLAAEEVNITDLGSRRTDAAEPVYVMVAEVTVPDSADLAGLEARLRDVAREMDCDLTFVPAEVDTL